MKINFKKRTKKAQELLDEYIYSPNDIEELNELVEKGVLTEEEEEILENYLTAG